jgi:biotin synthase
VTSISKKEIIELLELRGREQEEFHRKASEIRRNTLSDKVYFRGLIEFSNICINDCLYCGIRCSNKKISRYELSFEEILQSVGEVLSTGITSIVLQSGERRDRKFTSYVVYILKLIKEKYPQVSITLSVGEQTREVYEEFFNSGASRYLLRIETSDPVHYKKLHPESMSFENRIRCLRDLREIGFQVGTGVMINSPYQSLENLAEDLLFFKEMDIDMCGMGPYIPHADTPLGGIEYRPQESLNLGLNMIALLRHIMPDINIASTTALETLSPDGRELGLLAGANVVMPQFSPFEFRSSYSLYNNKPVGSVYSKEFIDDLKERIIRLGLIPDFKDHGVSVHFLRRAQDVSGS